VTEVEVNSTPLDDVAGETIQVIVRDISARKQHDAEFSDLHRRLTKLIDASARLLDSCVRPPSDNLHVTDEVMSAGG
jgi:hypothetical protein